MFLELWKGSSPSSQPRACPRDVAGQTSSGRAVSRAFKVSVSLTSEDDNKENSFGDDVLSFPFKDAPWHMRQQLTS